MISVYLSVSLLLLLGTSLDTHSELTIEEIERKTKLEGLRAAEENRRRMTEEADTKVALGQYYRHRDEVFVKKYMSNDDENYE